MQFQVKGVGIMNDKFKEKPLVTIGMPTYNRPIELEKAIISAINQTYTNLEILISDNCSTEELVDNLCKKYCSIDKRIKYVRQIQNFGPGKNYEYVFKNASGKYHIYLADDDWLSENYIEECVEFLEQNEGYAIAFGQMNFYNLDYSILRKCYQVSFDESAREDRIKKYCLTAINSSLSYGVVRIEEAKYMIQNLAERLPEDWIYMIKILFYGKGKYLSSISYNALNNGTSKNIDGLKKAFNLPNLTQDNFWQIMSENIVESILYDEFYQTRLEKSERISLALQTNNALIKNDIKPNIISRIINKLRRIYGK